MKIGEALIFEAFCSIHMSLFVLMPLAVRKDPARKKEIFIKYFLFRALILFIGNFINPLICILDFFTIFVMLFVVIPVTDGLKEEKRTFHQHTTVQAIPKVDYKENFTAISEQKLKNIGISDANLLKDELYSMFLSYENAYSNFDYGTLSSICTNKYFQIVSNELSYLENLKQQRVLENFIKNDIKIVNLSRDDYITIITAVIDASFNDYIKDEKGSFVRGNKYSLKDKKFVLTYYKVIQDSNKNNSSNNCPNCNAILDFSETKCKYCGSPINSKTNWKINSIKRVKEEKIIENNNPIKMNQN